MYIFDMIIFWSIELNKIIKIHLTGFFLLFFLMGLQEIFKFHARLTCVSHYISLDIGAIEITAIENIQLKQYMSYPLHKVAWEQAISK